MPITSSALKALRRDRRRTQVNRIIRSQLKTIIDQTRKSQDKQLLPEAYSVIDRAAKKKIIHPNKAARLKAQLSRMFGTDSPQISQSKSSKKTTTASKKTSSSKPKTGVGKKRSSKAKKVTKASTKKTTS